MMDYVEKATIDSLPHDRFLEALQADEPGNNINTFFSPLAHTQKVGVFSFRENRLLVTSLLFKKARDRFNEAVSHARHYSIKLSV